MNQIITTFKDKVRIESVNLSVDEHCMAVRLYNENAKNIGDYSLNEVETKIIEMWSEDEDMLENYDGCVLMKEALNKGGSVYTLKCGWQDIGEIVVYSK